MTTTCCLTLLFRERSFGHSCPTCRIARTTHTFSSMTWMQRSFCWTSTILRRIQMLSIMLCETSPSSLVTSSLRLISTAILQWLTDTSLGLPNKKNTIQVSITSKLSCRTWLVISSPSTTYTTELSLLRTTRISSSSTTSWVRYSSIWRTLNPSTSKTSKWVPS